MMLDEFNLINNLIKWMSSELNSCRRKNKLQGNGRINIVKVICEQEFGIGKVE